MKCIYCSANSNYKSRQANGGACGSCHRRFAFEPKVERDKLTDQKFKNVVDAVSDRGSLKFTSDHLSYELARRKATVRWLPVGASVMFVSFFVALLAASPVVLIAWVCAIPVVFAALRWYSTYRLRHAHIADVHDVPYLQSRWAQAHGPIAGLITRQEASQLAEVSIEPNPYYSFARLVVTDTRATAALLLANKFHIENECAVLCIDGFPLLNWHDMVALLRTNPNLDITLVHDATAAGCTLPSRIRQPEWFPEEVFHCVDAGLRPNQARRLNLPTLQAKSTSQIGADLSHLTAKDLALLKRGHHTELTALTPRRLMTSITRNFTLLSAARSDPEMAGASNATGSTWFFGSDDGSREEESFG
jgi:hypothetical protein